MPRSLLCAQLLVVFRRRDPLFDERVPLVALRALPEQLRAAIAASHADVGVEVEHGIPRQRRDSARPVAAGGPARKRPSRSPGGSPARAGCGSAPRTAVRAPPAASLAATRCRASARRARQSCGFAATIRRHRSTNRCGVPTVCDAVLQPIECEVGAFGRDFHDRLPRFPWRGPSRLPARARHRGGDTPARPSVPLDRGPESLGRLGRVARRSASSPSSFSRNARIACRDALPAGLDLGAAAPHFVGFAPLMLLPVQFLELHQCVTILRDPDGALP